MNMARLVLEDETEFEIGKAITTLGRTSDNDVSFAEDSNVSRYHAEIEDRGNGEFWLFDLQSSNGTTLNGEKVTSEKPLQDSDEIILGGSSAIRFVTQPADAEDKKETDDSADSESDSDANGSPSTAGAGATEGAAAAAPNNKSMMLLVFASLAVGLAVVLAVAAGLFFFLGFGGGGPGGGTATSSTCTAKADIIKPENGDILSAKTAVEVELDDSTCVSAVSFVIDGKEFAKAVMEPFKAELDPANYPDMADGRDRKVTVELYDMDGAKIPQISEIAISLETMEISTPETGPSKTGPGPGSRQARTLRQFLH